MSLIGAEDEDDETTKKTMMCVEAVVDKVFLDVVRLLEQRLFYYQMMTVSVVLYVLVTLVEHYHVV